MIACGFFVHFVQLLLKFTALLSVLQCSSQQPVYAQDALHAIHLVPTSDLKYSLKLKKVTT